MRRGGGKALERAILGSHVSLAGYAHVTADHRLSKAWQSFFSNRQVLACCSATLAQRIPLLDMVVRPGALWGLATASPLAADLDSADRIRSAQIATVASMMPRLSPRRGLARVVHQDQDLCS